MTAAIQAEAASKATEGTPAAAEVTSATMAAGGASWRERLGGPNTGPIVAIVGAALLAVGGFLPVWGTRLLAPQYPKGLELWFFGDRVEGPVREVNGLNHYIGMQPIDLTLVPEMALWPLAIVSSALLLVIAALWRGWISRFALLGLWLVPVVVLLDIQRWLIIFGTELDSSAALRLGGFIPTVVGPSEVWNFTILTFPGPALIIIWVVAFLATLAHRARQPKRRVRLGSAAIALVIAGLSTVFLAVPAVAEGASPSIISGNEATGPPVVELDLQALVDEAPPGTTVVVPAGSYRTHLVVDKPLTLRADGDVRLDGSGLGSVITITGNDVTVRGFEVANTGGQVEVAAAIKILEADNVTVEDNRLLDFFHGIASLGATNVRIAGNTITGSGLDPADADHLATGVGENAPVVVGTDPRSISAAASGAGPEGQGDGIYLWNTQAITVADNIIRDVRDGIYLSFIEDGLLDSNRVDTSRYAVHSMFGGPVTVFGNAAHENLAGLVFMYTKDVLAGRNVIRDQRSGGTGVGIVLKDVDGVRIMENVIARNRIGLKAEGTIRAGDREAAILRNRFDSNDTAVALSPSADLGFGANTFEGNMTDVQADDRGVARRNDWTFEGTGNHWSSYAGYDLDADGVGDVPHSASGSLQLILSDVPALQLYRGSPALRVLDSAQELWEADRAVVMSDSAPRLEDYAPSVRDLDPEAVQAASVSGEAGSWYVLGVSLAMMALLGTIMARLHRKGSRS
jgi:nitrous oxidase accessory protein